MIGKYKKDTYLSAPSPASPLLLEKSLQAQILIPLAASLAFVLAAATLAALFLVPAVYAILNDFGWLGALDSADDCETF